MNSYIHLHSMDSSLIPDIQGDLKPAIVREEIKSSKHIGAFFLYPGHKLWMHLNGEVREVTEDDYEEIPVTLDEAGNPITNTKRIKADPDANYFSALNLKNAIRQARNHGLYIREDILDGITARRAAVKGRQHVTYKRRAHSQTVGQQSGQDAGQKLGVI